MYVISNTLWIIRKRRTNKLNNDNVNNLRNRRCDIKKAQGRVYKKETHYNRLVGLCTGNADPDLWFSDSSYGTERALKATREKDVARALVALSICSICPIQKECLAEGMKPQNIEFGIWGGKLPGERLVLSGRSLKGGDNFMKITFARYVREAESLLLSGRQ